MDSHEENVFEKRWTVGDLRAALEHVRDDTPLLMNASPVRGIICDPKTMAMTHRDREGFVPLVLVGADLHIGVRGELTYLELDGQMADGSSLVVVWPHEDER